MFLACVRPDEEHPIRTLHYALRARDIRCQAVVNYKLSPTFKVEELLYHYGKIKVCHYSAGNARAG